MTIEIDDYSRQVTKVVDHNPDGTTKTFTPPFDHADYELENAQQILFRPDPTRDRANGQKLLSFARLDPRKGISVRYSARDRSRHGWPSRQPKPERTPAHALVSFQSRLRERLHGRGVGRE